MKHRGIQLQYHFGPARQRSAEIENPLFDLLAALAAAGSIRHAAERLGVSYRHFWGSLKAWEQTLGESLVNWERGQPARLTPFAERLLWSERQARVRLAPHIETLRRELQRVLDEALDGASGEVLRVDASHDLMLPALQELALQHASLHIELRFAGSLDALRSLAEGRCLVAGFHAPPLPARTQHYARAVRPMLEPGRHKLMGCMRRRQGLVVARGNPLGLHGLADLQREVAAGRVRFVRREAGSGTWLLLEHLLDGEHLGVDALAQSPTEVSHLAAAHAVASGQADATLALEAAAVQCGADFVPLADEDYFLVCLADALETPAVRALRRVLALGEWARLLATTRGYAPAEMPGQVLSLTRALPWWQFRTPR